jgi:hypothetical protein
MRPLVAHCHHGFGTLSATIGRHAATRAVLSAAIELYWAMELIPQVEVALAEVEGLGTGGAC